MKLAVLLLSFYVKFSFCASISKIAADQAEPTDQMLEDRRLLFFYRLSPKSRFYDNFYDPKGTASAICHNRGLKDWAEARKTYPIFNLMSVSELRDPPGIFSKWYKRDPTLFNDIYFTVNPDSYFDHWSRGDVVNFLQAPEAPIDPALHPSRLEIFFDQLLSVLWDEWAISAYKLNSPIARAKIMNYINVWSASLDPDTVLWLRARFDQEFVVTVDDPLIVLATDVRGLGVILRNAGKDDLAAPFFALLRDQKTLLSKYRDGINKFALMPFTHHRIFSLDPFYKEILKSEDRALAEARGALQLKLMTPEEGTAYLKASFAASDARLAESMSRRGSSSANANSF